MISPILKIKYYILHQDDDPKSKISLYIFKFFQILKSLFYPLDADQNKIQRDRKSRRFSSFSLLFVRFRRIYK